MQRESLLFILCYPCVCFKGRGQQASIPDKLLHLRGHGWEVWFITSKKTQPLTKQTLTVCDEYKYLGTSSNTLSCVNPSMCMICLHSGVRSELNWASTAGRMTVFAILEIIISDFKKRKSTHNHYTYQALQHIKISDTSSLTLCGGSISVLYMRANVSECLHFLIVN